MLLRGYRCMQIRLQDQGREVKIRVFNTYPSRSRRARVLGNHAGLRAEGLALLPLFFGTKEGYSRSKAWNFLVMDMMDLVSLHCAFPAVYIFGILHLKAAELRHRMPASTTLWPQEIPRISTQKAEVLALRLNQRTMIDRRKVRSRQVSPAS